jgi:hypothetical protein
VEEAQHLGVAGQIDPAVRNGVVQQLTAVVGGRTLLPGTVDRHGQVELDLFAADERRTELGPQRGRDVLGDGPAPDGEAELACGLAGRTRGVLVVGVTSDPAVVEGEQRVHLGASSDDLGRQLLQRDGCQSAVGMVQQGHLVDAELPGGALKLGGATVGEVGARTEGGALADREAHQPQTGADLRERGYDCTEPKLSSSGWAQTTVTSAYLGTTAGGA